jgi:hypothetical protein
MTVKELREKLQNVPEDVDVIALVHHVSEDIIDALNYDEGEEVFVLVVKENK